MIWLSCRTARRTDYTASTALDRDAVANAPAGVVSRRLLMLELSAGFVLTLAGVEALLALNGFPRTLRLSAGGMYLAMIAVMIVLAARLPYSLGWASRVTLLRAIPVMLIGGLVLLPDGPPVGVTSTLVLATAALLLDGVDGWVARRTASASTFGARFDMELDAFFILVLCGALVAFDIAGIWVLAIGLARYLFIAAQRVWCWLRAPLPPSTRRKLVCVWQIVTILVCLVPTVDPLFARGALALALALLVGSFGYDTRWLYVQHRTACATGSDRAFGVGFGGNEDDAVNRSSTGADYEKDDITGLRGATDGTVEYWHCSSQTREISD